MLFYYCTAFCTIPSQGLVKIQLQALHVIEILKDDLVHFTQWFLHHKLSICGLFKNPPYWSVHPFHWDGYCKQQSFVDNSSCACSLTTLHFCPITGSTSWWSDVRMHLAFLLQLSVSRGNILTWGQSSCIPFATNHQYQLHSRTQPHRTPGVVV